MTIHLLVVEIFHPGLTLPFAELCPSMAKSCLKGAGGQERLSELKKKLDLGFVVTDRKQSLQDAFQQSGLANAKR